MFTTTLALAIVARAEADPVASLVIEGACGVDCASTYVASSFTVENQSSAGILITRVEIDFRTVILPDR